MKENLPTLTIDSREPSPLRFTNLSTESGTLEAGTHTARHMNRSFAILCVTAGDVAFHLGGGRGAFMARVGKLCGIGFTRLLIVGTRREIERGDYRGKAEPRAVLASLAVIEARFHAPVVFEADAGKAALMVERWAFWHWREIAKPFVGNVKTPPWAV